MMGSAAGCERIRFLHNFEVMVTVTKNIGMLLESISIERRSSHDFPRDLRVFCQEGCKLAKT
jgi:hypothetical protein